MIPFWKQNSTVCSGKEFPIFKLLLFNITKFFFPLENDVFIESHPILFENKASVF